SAYRPGQVEDLHLIHGNPRSRTGRRRSGPGYTALEISVANAASETAPSSQGEVGFAVQRNNPLGSKATFLKYERMNAGAHDRA
ncbi:MAG: hypothetical protein ACRED4_01880, partial [Brevundimonas sp.]